MVVNSCGDAYKDREILKKIRKKDMLNPISLAFKSETRK